MADRLEYEASGAAEEDAERTREIVCDFFELLDGTAAARSQTESHIMSHIISFRSQPFPIPPDGRPIASKTITDTGAEMNTVIHPAAWQALSDG